jgi:hypothetical protein
MSSLHGVFAYRVCIVLLHDAIKVSLAEADNS